MRDCRLGTSLHIAALNGKLDVVRFLVQHGAHPHIKNSFGDTPLECAEASKHDDVVEYLRPITAPASEPTQQFTDGCRGVFHPVLEGFEMDPGSV